LVIFPGGRSYEKLEKDPVLFKMNRPKEEMIGIIGMCVMWFFVGLTYYNGIRAVLKDTTQNNKD
jgi:hypothetical protein